MVKILANETAEWISAFGQVIGALGTAGALWVGAVTLRRQINDKHREQASGVTVGCRPHHPTQSWVVFIENGSSLPLYSILFNAYSETGAIDLHQPVLAPGRTLSGQLSMGGAEPEVLANFKDASGNWWTRRGDGTLTDSKRKR
jgi:hypothetical protein